MGIFQKWDGFMAGIFLLAAVLLVFLEIIWREVFQISMMGVDQISSFLVIWSALLGGSYGIKQNIHVRVDVLPYLLPRKIALIMEVIVMAVCIAFSVALTWSGSLLIEESILLGEGTMGFIQIPMWIPLMIMPLAGVLFFVRFSVRMVEVLNGRYLDVDTHAEGEQVNVGSS